MEGSSDLDVVLLQFSQEVLDQAVMLLHQLTVVIRVWLQRHAFVVQAQPLANTIV